MLLVSLEAAETLYEWTRPWERGQIGEIVLSFVVLALALGWFSHRRWQEARRAVNERKRAERVLRKAKRRHRDLFEEAPLMCVITENRGETPIIIDCNKAFLDTVGYRQEEVLQHPLADFYTSEARARLLEEGGYRRALEDEFVAEERQLLARDGRVITTLLRAVPEVNAEGQVWGTRATYIDITEHKQAEEALKKSEGPFRELFENSPDAIFVEDLEGTVLDANPAACQLHGLDYEQLVGRNVRSLVPPDQHEQVIRDFAKMVAGELDSIEGFSWTADGREMPVEIRVSRITHNQQPALLLHVRDITERKRVEEALRESEERYRTLLQRLPVGVYRTTPDGRLIEANTAMATLLGVACIAELQPLKVKDLYYDPSDRNQHLEQLSTDDTTTDEFRLRRANGEVIWVRDYPRAIRNEHNEVVCFDGILLDITEQKRFETDLIEAKEKAEEANRLKGAFLANMSHEIRTPLTAIIGYADVLANETSETYRELVEHIQIGGRRLFETLNSVLDLARLEAGAFEPTLELLDLRESVYEAVALFGPLARGKGLDLKMDVARSPSWIRADRAGLGRILNNLLANAIKFTEEGSIIVRVGLDAASVRLEVEDTGIGMDTAFLPHLFDEFKQASTGLSRSHEGAGLGLTITKRLVRLFHGEITVESTKGAGTMFTVSFPKSSVAQESERPPRCGLGAARARRGNLNEDRKPR